MGGASIISGSSEDSDMLPSSIWNIQFLKNARRVKNGVVAKCTTAKFCSKCRTRMGGRGYWPPGEKAGRDLISAILTRP